MPTKRIVRRDYNKDWQAQAVNIQLQESHLYIYFRSILNIFLVCRDENTYHLHNQFIISSLVLYQLSTGDHRPPNTAKGAVSDRLLRLQSSYCRSVGGALWAREWMCFRNSCWFLLLFLKQTVDKILIMASSFPWRYRIQNSPVLYSLLLCTYRRHWARSWDTDMSPVVTCPLM